MSDILSYHPLAICITTYNRTDLALRTIKALKEYVHYPRISWHIADDGSQEGHIETLREAIGNEFPIYVTNANRAGVGKSMNLALEKVWELTHLVLLMEDDWQLTQELNIQKYINVLMNNEQYGMVRMGWLSTGTKAELVGLDGHCWWHLLKGSQQYVYSGQVSLRHKRFYDAYGPHIEGVNAGQQELDYGTKFNIQDGPNILWPVEFRDWGPFAHIGTESLNDIPPTSS